MSIPVKRRARKYGSARLPNINSGASARFEELDPGTKIAACSSFSGGNGSLVSCEVDL
jgi:hypothetical protein